MNQEKVVLIVEDSATIRFQVKTLLKQLSIELRETGGELGLFNRIEEYGKMADLVIMDLTLKEENGFELIKKLRSNDTYKTIPILVFTEHADAEHVLTAKQLGVDGYIRKPINKDFFIQKILENLKLTI